MLGKGRTWNFAVVGCDSADAPKHLGFADTRDEATWLQKNIEALGWRRVAIFDAELKEVKDEKPRKSV